MLLACCELRAAASCWLWLVGAVQSGAGEFAPSVGGHRLRARAPTGGTDDALDGETRMGRRQEEEESRERQRERVVLLDARAT